MKCTKLTKRIKLQVLGTIKDEYGEVTEDYQDFATVWAQIRPVTGKSFFEAHQVNSEITHQVIVRYREGIKPSMRVLYGVRVFEILYVMNFDEANESMQLMCKELI